MKISYRKLWVQLAEREMSKSDLRKELNISTGTLTKLNKNESVSLDILMRICEFLKCDIGNVCEFVREDDEKLKKILKWSIY